MFPVFFAEVRCEIAGSNGYALEQLLTNTIVNEILGSHNVDKQITDSRGDVRFSLHTWAKYKLTGF